jgi:hypothetical protein
MATFQTAPSPSPQALWMCRILSTDLQTPLHDQSKDATHTFPARFFHSQSAPTDETEEASIIRLAAAVTAKSGW